MGRLKELNLCYCALVNGVIVLEILCSEMPSLEVFRADYVSDLDMIQDPRPWSCVGLKELRLAFILPGRVRTIGEGGGGGEGSNSDNIVFTQLSRLTHLRRLSTSLTGVLYHHDNGQIQLPEVQDRPDYCMSFTLDRGLDRLKSLKQLEEILGHRYHLTPWTEAEACWILKHWVSLKQFHDFVMDPIASELLKNKEW